MAPIVLTQAFAREDEEFHGGSNKLDRWDLRKVKLKDVRRHIALVSQDSLMLPTTIAENIAYGRPAVTQADVQRADSPDKTVNRPVIPTVESPLYGVPSFY